MLASQFVTGLRTVLQSAVVGLEGAMDHLVMKVCFEKVKRREPAAVKITSSLPRMVSQSSPPSLPTAPESPHPKSGRRIYQTLLCRRRVGAPGDAITMDSVDTTHACPYPKPSRRDGEATGRPMLVVSMERRMDE